MKLKYFGDSYDIVKKSLLVWLAEFGPWSAHPMFTHQVIDAEAIAFETFLGVPLVSTEVLRIDVDRRSYLEPCEGCRSIFVDPDTGVRLTKRNGRRAPEFVFGDELVVLASERPTGLVMTFDQSLARGSGRIQRFRTHVADLSMFPSAFPATGQKRSGPTRSRHLP
jgi:hypothetical protein